MNSWNKINSMNSASPMMEQLLFFHDHTLLISTMITLMVLFLTIKSILNLLTNRFLIKNELIETMWTILPALILMVIALPSLKILYLMEETLHPSISIKTLGHQWYWTYEFSDNSKVEFESYMKKELSSTKEFRLLEVDNRLPIPFLTQIRLLISSSDVIHSWTIPSLGIKMDAIPGRINQSNILINKPGLFYGQCSEICGINHSFMPISIESMNMKYFIMWMLSF
nr:cytochrome c oxidase subunit II [Kinnaridae sp.]